MQYPTYLEQLIDALTALPGVGSRTAERFAFQILTWPKSRVERLAGAIGDLPGQLKMCSVCGCLMDGEDCRLCDTERRKENILCIVANPKDIYAIESTGEFRGLYHVLGGLLSPLEGRGPDQLRLAQLEGRLGPIDEAIIALDSTVEGDATSLYLKDALEAHEVCVSRLAFGLPMGSPLDYVDGGTLARAFSGRASF